MNLEELFIESYKKLQDKVKNLEEEINVKNKKILEFELFKKYVQGIMYIETSSNGKRFIRIDGSCCFFEDYRKNDFDKIRIALELEENE